ncbi:hypothetical protein BsWGS_04008 [Bradybaena similaris]
MVETCVLHGWSPNQTRQEVWELLLKEEEDETVYKLATFILLAILMLIGLPGNVLVLLVYGFRFPASTTKNFIMAMAVFDLINCVLGLPFEMVDLRYDIELDISVVCKIIRFWISLSACGSVTVLVAVSVDRFRRICQPFRKQMTVRQSKMVVGTMTLVSVGFAAPALVLYGRQTEIRYGIELHDCSIDDEYKTGTFAGLYQYILGITWTVSIVVLVVMYSFIIYKIQLQKKRRDRLSSQSHGSTSQLALQKVQTHERSPQTFNGVTRPNNEHSSIMPGSHIKAAPKENRHSAGLVDEDSAKRRGNRLVNRLFSRDVNPILEDEDSATTRGNRLVKRLFSRDVNPILENDGEDDIGELIYDTDDDTVPLADLECKAKLIKYKKTSLNNYLADSEDTTFTYRSDTIQQTDCTHGSVFCQSEEMARHRTRKCGHYFGRYRPWQWDQVTPSVGIISSARNRGWISHSDHTLGGSGARSHDYCCKMGRSASLCSLNCLVNQQQPARAMDTSSCCGRFNKYKSPSPELNAGTDFTQQTSRPGSSLASPGRQNMVPGAAPAPVTHPVGGAADLSRSHNKGSAPQAAADPAKGHKPGTVATTMTLMKKKKLLAREIKTSKVSMMMLMVTLGFVLSYLPHLCIQIFKSISPSTIERLHCSSRAYFVVLHFLMRSFFINNAINPIIYSFYNKTFRFRCLRLLRAPKSLLQSSEHHIGHALSFSQDNDTS